MTQATPQWLAIDGVVEAFETAQASDQGAELRAFLPPPGHPQYRAIAAELLCVDLEYAWSRGEARPLDGYLRDFPWLVDEPRALEQLAFEHFRQRQERGDRPDPSEYRRRYSIDVDDWSSSPQAATGELSRLAQQLDSQLGAPAGSVARWFHEWRSAHPRSLARFVRGARNMPGAGELMLDFYLVRELGRGAFGRAFLARQASLGGRLVVVKIAPRMGGESRLLARLQHTNIVPVYSTHNWGSLEAFCMPYFGATTLAQVLAELRGRSSFPDSGKYFLSTVWNRDAPTVRLAPSDHQEPTEALGGDDAAGPGPPETPKRSADAAARFENSSYVDVVLWLGARLADALAHAHARGVCHRDLKPANVLLADDGQPMLLDFNLAIAADWREVPAAVLVGGTLPYMSPEQLASFMAPRDAAGGAGRSAGDGIDERSDLYSLGVVLYELLTGEHPYGGAGAALGGSTSQAIAAALAVRRNRRLEPRRRHRGCTPAVTSILRKCLAFDRAERYRSAAELREDLERQLEHRPLRHAPDRSWRERWAKHRRRHPRLASIASLALAAAVVIGILSFAAARWSLEARRHRASDKLEAFQSEKKPVEVLLGIRTEQVDQLAPFERRAERLLAEYSAADDPAWSTRDDVALLAAGERRRLGEDIGQLSFLLARAKLLRAERANDSRDRQALLSQARQASDLAASAFRGQREPAAIRWQRRQIEAFALLPVGSPLPPLEQSGQPTTLRDHYLAAADLAAASRHDEALPLVERIVERAPEYFPGQFLLGSCCLALSLDARAEQAFTLCAAMWPEFPWSYFNRALARNRLRKHALARDDLDRVARLVPDLAEARIERALTLTTLGDYPGALADLERAQALGVDRSKIALLTSRVHARAGDHAKAAKSRQKGIAATPVDEQGFVARGMARLPENPREAIADFDRALAIDPNSRSARQNKAYVLSEILHDERAAIDVLGEAIARCPGFSPVRGGRGVLLARAGEREAAHADAEACLAASDRSEVLYQVAGIYALTSASHPEDRRVALALLSRALADNGYGLDLIAADADLNAIRGDGEFQALVRSAQLLRDRSTRN